MNDHIINKELINQVLREILSEEPTLNSKCTCHVIDATKTRILAWPTGQPNNPYLLKIGLQRFIAYNCKDRNGQIYWRFREFEEDAESQDTKPAIKSVNPPATPPKKTSLEHHWTPLVQEEKKAPVIEVNKPLYDDFLSPTDRLAKFKARQEKAQQLQDQKVNHEPINPISTQQSEPASQ